MRDGTKDAWLIAALVLGLLATCAVANAQDLTPNLVGGQYHTTPPTATNGQLIGIQVDNRGVVQTSATVAAGTAIIGKVGIDQTTPGTTDSVTVKSAAFTSPATVTRPANQTPYTGGDVVGGAITFASAGPTAGGNLIITSAELELDVTAIPAGMTSFNLYLYNVTPPSATADNSPFDLAVGDRASFIGKIAMGSPVDEGSTLYSRVDQVQAHILAASGSVFGYLVTVGGYTPAANSEVYKVTLHAIAP
jgi:hypothetical protein